MDDVRDTALVALICFLVGGAVGAGLALAYAPYSGKKTRKKLKGYSEDLKEQLADYADGLKDRIK